MKENIDSIVEKMANISGSKKKLDGKVAIITGGASGIGEATARLFATNGILAIIIADIQDELAQSVVNSIGSNICSYFHCDVSEEEQVKSMIAFTITTYGRLDIMFSNAGIFNISQTVLDLDLSFLDRTLNVNARGMAACVKHAARAMVEGRIKGSIVCTASVTGSMGGDNSTDYFMSKHAVIGLMRCAAKQLGAYGIRVNTVSPFAVGTPMLVNAFGQGPGAREKIKQFQGLTCLKDVVFEAEHVADAVLFLASEDSAFITGHDMKIDGGFTC